MDYLVHPHLVLLAAETKNPKASQAVSFPLSMDTLSSSVSSFKVPAGLHSTSRQFSHFRTPSTPRHHHLPPHPHLSSTGKPNSISDRTTSSSAHKNFSTSPVYSSSQTFSLKQSPIIHRNAASGYAAALVDVARCNNALEVVERDVRRFAKLLRRDEPLRAIMTDPFMDEKEKGHVLKEVAEKGRFHRHLVALLKMLVEKSKLGLVDEVLGEFGRIFDELCGTHVVLVSSDTKMADDQLFGIAKKVQKLSGAMKVKVLVDHESLPSLLCEVY